MSAAPATLEQQRAFRLAAAATAGRSTEPLPGYSVAAIWGGYEPPRSIYKRLLIPNEITMLFGESGHFKSVIAIDLALCAANGLDFHGVKGRGSKVGVLYVNGEGHDGFRKRTRAHLMAHGFDSTSEQPALYVTTRGADLIGNPEQLRLTVEAAAKELGVPIELLVIDTYTANLGQGDQDRPEDTTLALDSAQYAAPGAAVLLVHHTGHGDKNRERGSYELRARSYIRLQATYDDTSKLVELKWHRAKDDELPEPLVFEWRRVGIDWRDEHGEELTSVVLERLADGAAQAPRLTHLGKWQEMALRTLRTLYARAKKNMQEQGRDPAEARILVDGWKRECDRKGMPRQRWSEVLRELQDRRLVLVDGPHVTLADVIP